MIVVIGVVYRKDYVNLNRIRGGSCENSVNFLGLGPSV